MDERRGIFEELKRRNVFRAAGMYLVVAWLLLQVGETTFEALGLPDGSQRFLIVLLALGFPVAPVRSCLLLACSQPLQIAALHPHFCPRLNFGETGPDGSVRPR
jgi:hypothetical protein